MGIFAIGVHGQPRSITISTIGIAILNSNQSAPTTKGQIPHTNYDYVILMKYNEIPF